MLARMGLLTVLALVAVAAMISLLLIWSTREVDAISVDRQRALLRGEIAKSIERVAHDQESVTVWDDALRRLDKRPLDMAWLDNNVGVWLHTYFGHDAAYVIDGDDRPLYAMIDGRRVAPASFDYIAGSALPLVHRLRARLRDRPAERLPNDVLSPGEADIIAADGHPAIVSVKPHLAEMRGGAGRVPARYIHISVRRLDGDLLAKIGKNYAFQRLRFAWSDDRAKGEVSQPLLARDGWRLGYFIWRPFAPGSQMLSESTPVLLSGGLFVGMLVLLLLLRVATKTRELQDSKAAAQHLAFHDPLTTLPNRALFDDRLDHVLTIFRATGTNPVALLYLDLDRFKKVNDTMGHPTGDDLIREFARRLSGIVRAGDTAARVGGDEFAVIQAGVKSSDDAENLCRRIVAAASEPFDIGGSQIFVGVSIGVAMAGVDGADPTELARKADIALYHSKAQGGGHYRFFAENMDEPIRIRQTTERDLRIALGAQDQLSVVYQPQYSGKTGAISGVEALVRWRHPARGMISPEIFIPIAEETGLIEPLGEWVLAQACAAGRAWPIATISVNISAIQLRSPHFATRVLRIVADAGIAPERLQLEITETALIENAKACMVNLRLLRSFGIRVALDDFGTGYSSLSHLTDFEVDQVKIDRSFVERIDAGPGGSPIIRAIVELAGSTGLGVTAEGVETREQLDFLCAIGCDELQGYLLSRPLSREALETLLGSGGDNIEIATSRAA